MLGQRKVVPIRKTYKCKVIKFIGVMRLIKSYYSIGQWDWIVTEIVYDG